ncbi:MAG: aspartyl/asparaginyl beta-hydroxylase domain-containing protein [Pseudomonadota bacterium]
MTEAAQQAADGLRALQAGDTRKAYKILSDAVSAGEDSPPVLRGLSLAARKAGYANESLEAAEKLLSRAPGDLEAMLLKADALNSLGNLRKASEFYFAAVKSAPPQMSGPLALEIERAKKECQNAAVRYEEFLRSKVKEMGIFDGLGHTRGEQALDILFGRKQIYYQQPEKFYFPELPQIQFYDPLQFAWTKELIAQTNSILSELEAVLSGTEAFEAYVPASSDTPHLHQSALTGNTDWGAFHLIKDGVRIQDNVTKCPATMSALSLTPQPNVKGKSPIALFSRLKPGARIPPHTGLMNTRIICHLPLIIPDNCHLRVGNQMRQWKPGEMLIFDDSIEHEARNQSASDRIILLFDIWRPELGEDERGFISAIFDGIEEYGVFT